MNQEAHPHAGLVGPAGRAEDLLDRYSRSYLQVFGRPQRVLERGQGVRVWDVQGREYLDLLAGIAVNALGHSHPDLVAAIAEQAGQLIHTSNFFTTPTQVALAERLLGMAGAPAGSAVLFVNSGAEAIEAAIKLGRRTGRPGIITAQGAFHGRTTGALALTAKAAYREPFEPLLPGINRVPFGDEAALRAALDDQVGAVILEPIQGEGGVVPAPPGYLQSARELTREHGALLVLDEIQTGIGRTGTWFAFQQAGITPDAITLAKGLGGGFPIGALITFGPEVSGLLSAGQHGTTFGGNPLACAAGLAVLEVIERDGLLGAARTVGQAFTQAVAALQDPRITGVRGEGLLIGIGLAGPWAPHVATAALDRGFIVNAVREDTIRLAPPLIVQEDDMTSFALALPTLLDSIGGDG
ncbi:acetylornithine transaminase [Gephyromycinifex aptenodytis]|uniref:acetylornithine transaminase n=1 Tax=Gephyromycinifex aptenodytis TaxID=2716227 RepID=UPI0014466AC5|nr:acetylornithine transaminase [Gephyromycinifex aptenodytis]